jgi:hypothetical protein
MADALPPPPPPPAALCTFGASLLPHSINNAIPTIAVEAANSGFFSFSGSFTSARKETHLVPF